MNFKITFQTDRFDDHEILRVQFSASELMVPMRPPLNYGSCRWGCEPRIERAQETREEYGRRLREAARDLSRHIENNILAQLRTMGHLA